MSKLYNFIIEEKEQCWCAAMVLSLLGYIKEDYYNLDSSTIRLNSFVKELEKRDDKVLIVKESDVNGKKAYPGHRSYDINPDSCGYKAFCDCFRKDLASTLIEIYLGGYIEEKTLPQITFGYEEDDEILIGGKNNPVKNKKLEKFSRYYVSSRDNSIIGYSPYCNYSDYKQISSRIIVKFGECCNAGEGINSLREVVETLSSLGFTWATYNNPFTFDSLLDYISRCKADIIYLNLKNKTVQYGKEKDSNTFLKPLIINVEEVKDILRSFNVNKVNSRASKNEEVSIRVSNDGELKRLLYYLSKYGYLWDENGKRKLITLDKCPKNSSFDIVTYINIDKENGVVCSSDKSCPPYREISEKDWIKEREKIEEEKRVYSKTLTYINILDLLCFGYKFEKYPNIEIQPEEVDKIDYNVTVDVDKKLILGYGKKKYPLLSEIYKETKTVFEFIIDQIIVYDLSKRNILWKTGNNIPSSYDKEIWEKSLFKDGIDWRKVFEDKDYSDVNKLYPFYVRPNYCIDFFGASFFDFKSCVALFQSQGFEEDEELRQILEGVDEDFCCNCRKRCLFINESFKLSLTSNMSSTFFIIPIRTFLEENKSRISRLNYERNLIFSEPGFERVYCKDIIQIKNILIRLMELGYIWKQGMLITPNDIPSVIVKESKEGITFILNEVTKEVYYTREKESEFKEADKWLNESQKKMKNYDKYEVKKTDLKKLIKKGYKWDGRERYSFIDYPCFYKDNIKYIVNPGCKKIMGYRYEEENKSSKVFIRFDKHKEVLENIIDCRIAIEILSEASEFKSCNDVESRDKIIEVRNFSELMGEQLEKNFAIVLDLEEKTYKLVTLPEDKTEGMSEILIEEIIYLMPLSNCLIGFNRHIILEILREHARQNKIIDFSIIANSITSVAVFDWEKSGKKQFWREIFIDRNFYHFYDFYPDHPRSYISIKDSEKLNKLIEKGYRISQLRDKNKEPVKCYLVDEKNKILFQEPEASPYWEEFEIKENVYEDSILEEVNTVTKSSYSSFKDIDWSEVSLSSDISEEFIEEYKDYLDWELVSSYITLNENTIEKYENYLNWDVISKYQVLSPEFMEKYKNKLDWGMISKHQPFVDSEKLVGTLRSMYDGCNSLGKLYQQTKERGWFFGYITIEDLDNKPSEFEFRLGQYRNYVCKVKIYWRDLTSTWPNAKKFYKEDENGESMYEEVNRVAGTGFISDRGIDWDIVSSKHRLPEWFIYKYRKELNWLIISNEQILSEVFLEVHKDFYNFVISEKQPFVDPRKLDRYQRLLYENNNHLGKLYQKTKDIGFFTAFISDVDYIDDKSINGYRFSISSKHGFTKQVKIYWKDLISPDLVSKFYELSKEGKEDSVMLQNFPRGIVIVKHIDSGDRRVISGILDLFIRKEGFNYVGLNPGEEGIVDNIPYPGESKKDLLMLINKGDKTLTIKEEDGIVFNERGITTLSLSAFYRNIKDFVEEKNLDRPENLKILNNDKSINSFKNKKVMKNSMFDGIIEKFKSQYVPEIDNNIMISMDGNLCVKAGDEAVSVSKDSCEIVSYPVEMCFDIPGLLISKPVNMIVPGDIVKFKETYYKVLEVNPNGTIKVISFSTGTISSKKTIKDFVTGSNLVKVIINFMNGINPGLNMQQGMNPVMMAMMFQEGKDSDDMLKNMIMLSMMNPNSGMNAFTGGMMNPVMMAMMMKDSSFAGEGNDMFKMMAVMSMFNNQGGMFQTGFNNACQVNNPSIVDQPKPEKRERVSRKPRAKKVETSGEGGAGIEM